MQATSFECHAPLFCVLPPSLRPYYFLFSRAYSYASTYPTVLTIVHLDGTYILSLYNINAKDYSGETALYWAAKEGHKAMVHLLLKYGADVNVRNDSGHTALYWATITGHEAMVQLLLKNGADVNAKDYNGRTALYWATMKGHKAVEELLLEDMANATDNDR